MVGAYGAVACHCAYGPYITLDVTTRVHLNGSEEAASATTQTLELRVNGSGTQGGGE